MLLHMFDCSKLRLVYTLVAKSCLLPTPGGAWTCCLHSAHPLPNLLTIVHPAVMYEYRWLGSLAP